MRSRAILGVAAGLAAAAFAGCGEHRALEGVPSPPSSTAAKPPPPISGGTLLHLGGDLFLAADPDTDQVHFARFGEAVQSVDLELGDEPGRLALGEGKVYVALRGSGAIASIDLDDHAIERRAICPAPRGLAVQGGLVHVACAGGELVTLDADLDAIVSQRQLDRDLRDVVALDDGRLAVSVFRSAELFLIDPAGDLQRLAARGIDTFAPAVAWRTIAVDDQIVMLHQRASTLPIPTGPPATAGAPYYGANQSLCFPLGILHAASSIFDPNDLDAVEPNAAEVIGSVVLPVDIAIAPGKTTYAVAAAGSDAVLLGRADNHYTLKFTMSCPNQLIPVGGQPVAVAFGAEGTLAVQRRNPAGLLLLDSNGVALDELAFGGPSRRDVGHLVFHNAASPTSAIACASCHPEGHEDGHVWRFEHLGARRTQTVAGGVLDTAPLHWDGDLAGLDTLMSEVFVNRMGGAAPREFQVEGLGQWLQSLPHLPASPVDPEATARGAEIYVAAGCDDCHSGAKLTNNLSVAVGTGGVFQVPSLLGIADRAPFMHDGCAATLLDRFDPSCGGGDLHGVTSNLTGAELADLVTYLESL